VRPPLVKGAPRALARRYARALVDVAQASGPQAMLELRDELQAFAPQLQSHEGLRRALEHPALPAEQKKRVVLALAESAGATPLLRKLVELLAARNRLQLLPDVAGAYAELASAAQGIVTAEVVSATPLPDAQKQALVAALGGGGGGVELRTEVDPALVGGLVVRLAGRTYDGSVRARLAALRQRLASAG
jgi:F-type H+-transporting ATPase subunit delta